MKDFLKKLLIFFAIIFVFYFVCGIYQDFKTEDYLNAIIGLIIIVFLLAITITVIVIKKSNETYEDDDNIYAINKTNTACIDYKPIHEEEKQGVYKKKKIMTHYELNLYNKLLKIINNEKYVLQAQIPLSSIIFKTENNFYANELFRTIDFGIFDKTGEIKVLIELNDNTHNIAKRKSRDIKVKKILEDANIPLITLWTNQPNFSDYIAQRLSLYIDVDYI